MALANSVTLRLAGITANTPRSFLAGSSFAMAQGKSHRSAQRLCHGLRCTGSPPPLSHEQRLKAIKTCLGARRLSWCHQCAAHESRIRGHRVYQEVACRRRTNRAHLLLPPSSPASMISKNWRPARLWWSVSPHRCSQSLRGRFPWLRHSSYFFDPFTDQPNNHGLLSDEMHPISLIAGIA